MSILTAKPQIFNLQSAHDFDLSTLLSAIDLVGTEHSYHLDELAYHAGQVEYHRARAADAEFLQLSYMAANVIDECEVTT